MSPGDGKKQCRLISLHFESKQLRLLWNNGEKCIKKHFFYENKKILYNFQLPIIAEHWKINTSAI